MSPAEERLDTDAVVVGAGVVGLAIAAELGRRGCEVLVLERREAAGRETSSRNSQVIHAGLYYEPGSLKARLCLRGARLLYEACAELGVPHRRVGKLVVAGAGQLAALEALWRRAESNGARGLTLLERHELRRLEPAVEARAALLSPATGIVDAHELVKATEARATAAGAWLLFRRQLVAVDAGGGGFALRVTAPAGEERLRCRLLVNAAGLEADRVAAMAGVGDVELCWCKGDYFSVVGPASRAVSRLIYPLPDETSLGIHATLDLGGRMLLGPDATYVDRPASPAAARRLLTVDPAKAERFRAAVSTFLPALATAELQPDQSGMRPKIQRPGEPPHDFVIRHERERLPGMVNLLGIESPGLTCAWAIGEHVAGLLAADGLLRE